MRLLEAQLHSVVGAYLSSDLEQKGLALGGRSLCHESSLDIRLSGEGRKWSLPGEESPSNYTRTMTDSEIGSEYVKRTFPLLPMASEENSTV